MPYAPDRRFTPNAMAAITDAGWTPEPLLAKIMGRTWAILSRPHPAGGDTRLMLDATGISRRELTHDLPQWSAHLDALPAPVDFPGFALAVERELLGRGVRHHGWNVMGVYGGGTNNGITDMVTFEVKAAENDAPADVVVNVSCALDPAKAAETIAKGLREAWNEVAAFNTEQAGTPLVERSAVVAACSVASHAFHALTLLNVRPPIRIVTRFELTRDRPGKPSITYRTLPSERYFTGDPGRPRRTSENRMVRTERGVWARVGEGRLRWNGNTLVPRDADEFPDTIVMALAGRPIEDVVDHAVLRGSGLIVERAWMSPGKKRRFLRVAVRSDLMTIAEARPLAERLVRQRQEEFREMCGDSLPLNPRYAEEPE